jgi:hypothetical protein
VIRALIRISRDISADPTIWVDAMVVARPDVDRATLETLAQSFADSWSLNGGMNASTSCASPPSSSTKTEDFVGPARGPAGPELGRLRTGRRGARRDLGRRGPGWTRPDDDNVRPPAARRHRAACPARGDERPITRRW